MIILPDYLKKKDKEDIKRAIKNNIPIIISGNTAKSGKTTLCNLLRSHNILAYEEFECCLIKLD